VHILMHNARQIFSIMAAASGDSMLAHTYEGIDCSQLSSSTEASACRWHALDRDSRTPGNDEKNLNVEALQVWLPDSSPLVAATKIHL
jgi:hypothetical protein